MARSMSQRTVVEVTLVLVPGLVCDADVWRDQRHAVRTQVCDHGDSDSIAAMAQLALARAPARFALAGHSMGGRVAFEMVRQAPSRVLGLAVFDTGYTPLPPGDAGVREQARREAWLLKAQRDGMRAMALDWVQEMVHPARLHDGALIEDIVTMMARKTAAVYAAQMRALLQRPDATALLPRIDCPALVACGREDGWAPPSRHLEMAALIPGATLLEVPDCGHMSPMERPQAVNDALRTWLAAVHAQWDARAARVHGEDAQ
jgi:pimeloyl-ACP methyl ester carboxylesterase